MKNLGFFVLVVLSSLVIAGALPAMADQESLDRGLYLRSKGGEPFPAPAVGTTVEVRVTGIVARARVTQIFSNPTPDWVEGIYVFPLPDGAAVDTLRMTVGDRVLEGVVREKQQATEEYVQAKQEGRRASLVEFLRPGVFSTAVANLGPGETVEITLEMQQVVEVGRSRFGLRFPMVVPPRYAPKPEDALPIPAPVAGPAAPSFAFHVDLSPGFPLGRIESSSHQIAVARDDRRLRYAVDLKDGVAPADSDFVLDWTPAVGREPRAVYFTEEVDGERYALLMVLPPDVPEAAAARLPRETVYVIDTSRSMINDDAIVQARQALLLGLDRLAPTDAFEVVQFSTEASALFQRSVAADPGSLGQAKTWVAGLQADGGTNMLAALKIALGNQGPSGGLLRQVIFVTDGQVANEDELLHFIGRNLGESRLFTVAIGSAPNAAFLRKATGLGRGTFTAIASTSQVVSGMDDLFARIEAPMLRDVAVRWADPIAEMWPERVPDLYLGEPIVATARLRAAGPVEIEGLRGGEPWRDEIPAAAEVRGAGLDKLWAGRKIQALLDSLTAGVDAGEVRRQVAALGLRHHLLTPYTSLVVTDVEPARPPGAEPATHRIPGAMPRGAALAAPAPPPPDPGADLVFDQITLTAESPLLDERQITTGATVSQTEITLGAGQGDVWAALAATPGVLTDRINVGGNESGRLPAAAAGGTSADPALWTIDGMTLTDHAALGTSPSYYDFDAFEEMQVATGGADAALETAGPQLSLIAPRGTNEWRAAGRLVWTGGALAGDGEERLDGLRVGSGEAGGPLRRDRFWLWGSLSRSEIDRIALGGDTEALVRDSAGLKLNGQLAASNSATLLVHRGEAAGTGAGAAPSRSRETLWDQDGREVLWKVEDTHIFTSSFYLTGALSGNEGTLRSLPEPDPRGNGRIDAAGVARGSWFAVDEEQRTREAELSASWFTNTESASHEIRVGAQSRSLETERLLTPPARLVLAGEALGLAPGLALAELWQGGRADAEVDTQALWLQDTVTLGRATFALGLRWDRQDLGIAGVDRAETLAPRLGMTYGAGPSRKLLLRATFGRFASRLGAEPALASHPAALRAQAYLFEDLDSDLIFEPDEPQAFAFAERPLGIASDLSPEITDETALAVEYALLPEMVLGLRGTLRETSDILDERWQVLDFATGQVGAATSADWVLTGSADGSLAWYDLRPGVEWTGGHLLANGDRRREAFDLAAFWQKRLANHWMSRGHVAWHDWTWRVGPESARFDDPTPALGGGDRDGQRVLLPVGGGVLPHEPASFLGSRWSFHVMGMVQLPRGFDVSLAVDGREGVPFQWYRQVLRERTGLVRVPVSGPEIRTDDLVTADLLLAKEIVWNDLYLTLGLDVFNLLDAGTVAGRELDLGVGRAAQPTRIMAPRTWRLGVRIAWR